MHGYRYPCLLAELLKKKRIYPLSLESKHSILDFVFQKNAARQNLKTENLGSRLLSSTDYYIVAMVVLSMHVGHSLKWYFSCSESANFLFV